MDTKSQPEKNTTPDSKSDERPDLNKFLDNTPSGELDSDKPAETQKP